MDPKKFIKIFTKKDFRKEIITDLKKEMEEYPFFSPVIIAYLLTLRLNDDPSFRNELLKYSHYISDRKRFIRLLFEIELIKEKIKYKLTPEEAEQLEKEIYERSKQKHEQIIREIIEPKIEKLRKLAELSRTQKQPRKTTEAQTETTPTPEAKTSGIQEKSGQQETETKDKTVELKVTITPPQEEQEQIKVHKEESAEQLATKNIADKEAEKIQRPEPLTSTPQEKTSEQEEKHTPDTKIETETEKPSDKEEKNEEEKVVTIDDIFKKIAELKKQKLSAKEEFKQRITTIDQLMEEQKSREEITHEASQPKPADKPRPDTLKDKEEKAEAEKISKDIKQESQKEESKEKAAEKEEKILELDLSDQVNTEDKTKETHKEQPQKVIEIDMTEPIELETEAKEKIEEKTSKQEKTMDKTAEIKTETDKKVTVEKSEETAEPKPESAAITEQSGIEAKTENKAPGTPQTTPVSEGKKTAADRILEEIRRRREEKMKQQQLIDKFLKEQPSIDRKKEPTVEGDLSEKASKEPDLVTEKMARIYELQELYDKAIETYEKLILKFPEKSDYFAKKIQELKQKLNK